MNIDKCKLKVDIANHLGADIEDRVEGELKAAHELSGAADALKQAAIKVPRDLAAKIDTALAEGEIKDLGALEVAEFAKKYLAKAGDFLMHLSEMEKQKSVAQLGRVDGLRFAMESVKKMRDAEVQRIQAVLDSIEEDGEPPRTQASLAREAHGSAADRKAAVEPPAADGSNGTQPSRKTRRKKGTRGKNDPAIRAVKKVE